LLFRRDDTLAKKDSDNGGFMGLALFKERRMSERRMLTGLLPGKLILKETNAEVKCRPINVSEHGIGIVVAAEWKQGTLFTLMIPGKKPVELEVAWTKPDFSKQNMNRYGLVTIDSNVNLESEFIRAGCIKK
jgi:hypothetical protein